jgi:hypothetical protein
MSIPMLFRRNQPCPPGSDIQPNSDINGPHRVSYIVALPTYTDYTHLRTAWQDNPVFPEGEICIPSIDILGDENTFVFDGPDPDANYRQAHAKMKELWAQASPED